MMFMGIGQATMQKISKKYGLQLPKNKSVRFRHLGVSSPQGQLRT